MSRPMLELQDFKLAIGQQGGKEVGGLGSVLVGEAVIDAFCLSDL